MLKENMTQRGTLATGLGVLINRFSPDNLHARPSRHPANVGCSCFKYTNDELRNHTIHRCRHKTGTWNTNNLYYTDFLGTTLHKEDIEKE